jgi:hypothetical protein
MEGITALTAFVVAAYFSLQAMAESVLFQSPDIGSGV